MTDDTAFLMPRKKLNKRLSHAAHFRSFRAVIAVETIGALCVMIPCPGIQSFVHLSLIARV